MAEVNPLPAASVIVLRDAPLELLMLRRHENSSFVPDAWVFPGGVVEPIDEELGEGSTLTTMRLAGARETFEESGLWLGAPLADAVPKRQGLLSGSVSFRTLVEEAPIDLETLVWTSRWITPVGVPKRFDTYFFLAAIGRDVVASVQESEASELLWISPKDALAAHKAKEMKMVFPTLRNLEALTGFTNAREAIEARRGAVIEAIQPIIVNGRPTLP
jgi:8-oxo-dGTP pyrophosphatase MutT (NUDIX family)